MQFASASGIDNLSGLRGAAQHSVSTEGVVEVRALHEGGGEQPTIAVPNA
jgi:hypothetical protein